MAAPGSKSPQFEAIYRLVQGARHQVRVGVVGAGREQQCRRRVARVVQADGAGQGLRPESHPALRAAPPLAVVVSLLVRLPCALAAAGSYCR
jgi:hypothetical protein